MPVDWKNQYFKMAVLSELSYALGEALRNDFVACISLFF